MRAKDREGGRSGGREVEKAFSISRSPDYTISRLLSISRSPDLPISRSPDLPRRYNPPHSKRGSHDVSTHVRAVPALSLRAPNTMKHTLRCHDSGLAATGANHTRVASHDSGLSVSQNRASPQGVAAIIAASFVANLANTASIGCGSLRAIDDSDSQRTRVSSC